MFWIILLLLYFGVGFLCAGYNYAYFTRAWPALQGEEQDEKEKSGAWCIFFGGFFAAPAVLFPKYARGRMTDYGWRKWW